MLFINADQFFTKDICPSDLHQPALKEIEDLPETVCRGGSCVIDPFGHAMHEPEWDQETIICENLDMSQTVAAKMEFDPVGHYARNDVMKLEIDDR